jgi:membrane-associated phospholipid phosphatase
MSLPHRQTELVRALAPLDMLTILYTASSFLVLSVQAIGQDSLRLSSTEFGWLLGAHALLVVLVLLAAQARTQACSNHCFLAEWYPLVVLTAVYASVDLVNGPRAAAGLSHDAVIQRLEFATFGRQLAHDWSRSQTQTAFSWPLSLSYLGFFPLVIAAPAVLWWRGHIVRARQTIFGISLAFFTCYLVFLLFPVAGPTYLWGWPTDGAHTALPSRLVRDLIDGGDSWGSAFPSSHVAASMAAALLAFRNWRPLGWVLLPFAVGILIGVVYFQVHYAVDAVAGLIIAVFATTMAARLIPAHTARA